MSWASKFSKPYRVEHDKKFRLKDHDPADTAKLYSHERGGELLAKGIARMAELQDKLYAQDRWGLLLIFQAMDAAGKDGVVKHVMSGVNPQGCQVYSFKTPSAEELDHDYLWRTVKCLPERGRIGIFNRSYYEEVLIVRVHPEILATRGRPRLWSQKTFGRNDFRIFALSSATSPAMALSSASSFSMCQRRSRRRDSWIACSSRRRTGSFLLATSTSANAGTTT